MAAHQNDKHLAGGKSLLPDDDVQQTQGYNTETDYELVLRLKEDDVNAFEELFGLYKNRVYSFVNQLLSNSHEAEEIVQEVFIKLWSTRSFLDVNKSLSSYLFTISKNKVYDFLRKKLNQKAYIETLTAEDTEDHSVLNDIYYKEAELLLNKVIAELPERCQHIFKMSRFEGKSYKEIARALCISENTVDTQIRRALKHLRKTYPLVSQAVILFLVNYLKN